MTLALLDDIEVETDFLGWIPLQALVLNYICLWNYWQQFLLVF